MFSKSKSAQTSRPAGHGGGNGAVPPSIIASDMRVLGDLETTGDVQIDGRIDGDLRTHSVTVGKGATVNGAIHAEKIRIAGSVNGEIRGAEVILSATAHVVGDIHHQSLSIDAGAFLQGLCKRIGEETVKPGSEKPVGNAANLAKNDDSVPTPGPEKSADLTKTA